MPIRKRSLPPPGNTTGTVMTMWNQGVSPAYPAGSNFQKHTWPGMSGSQITDSEGHHVSEIGKSLNDIGGPFYTQKSYVEGAAHNAAFMKERPISGGRKETKQFSGPVWPYMPLSGGKLMFPNPVSAPDGDLDELGAEAIARCKPTNSLADLSTFLGELLKDGLPSLVGSQAWKDRTNLARGAGSEYLNVQFGWQPLLSDISKFGKSVIKLDDVVSQYERDAGRVVRRRYQFPIQRSTTETRIGTAGTRRAVYQPIQSEWVSGPAGTVFMTEEKVIRTWFSGAFTYHLPSGYDSRKKVAKYRLIADRLGLSLSPDNLWELAPWSWAVDWFSNAGDVLSNVTDFANGGLVMHYGYIMQHCIVKHTYRLTDYTGVIPELGVPAPLVLVTETKKRRQANPFGFGVNWDGLSSFQASILAALGITRGRR